MSIANDLVLTAVDGAVATLTLNRPDKGNALSSDMIVALEAALIAADADPAVRVIVIAARGKIFSAGHDLAEMRSEEDKAFHEALFARCSRMMARIRRSGKPVIAKVQGAAVAAGCQLVATCDLAYAAETAKFGVNGINLGLFCSTPAVAVSRAVPVKQALDLLLTGRLVLASEAVRMGLINGAVPAADLDAAVAEAAGAIAAKAPEAIALGKRMFHEQIEMCVDDAYAFAGERMAENMQEPETRRLIDGFVARSTR